MRYTHITDIRARNAQVCKRGKFYIHPCVRYKIPIFPVHVFSTTSIHIHIYNIYNGVHQQQQRESFHPRIIIVLKILHIYTLYIRCCNIHVFIATACAAHISILYTHRMEMLRVARNLLLSRLQSLVYLSRNPAAMSMLPPRILMGVNKQASTRSFFLLLLLQR